MKNLRILSYTGLVTGLVILTGCKDYLNLSPLDKLTGNNFFQSPADVEANITQMYNMFYLKITQTHVQGAIGEYRSGEVLVSQGANAESSRKVIEALGRNEMNRVISGSEAWEGYYHYHDLIDWKAYYQVIQSANILIEKLKEGIPGMTGPETKRYIAEATFIRCFTYFWIVRIFGDVVYYTTPYQAEALPRMNMVTVMNNCIADLSAVKDDLPWIFSDPGLKGARASRGSALALLMHMNMWNAGFDVSGNKDAYYQKTADYGAELMNSKVYRLIPMNEWGTVLKGKSDESLFEFYHSINYNDSFNLFAPIFDVFLHWPYKLPRIDNQVSIAYYRAQFMQRLYPSDVTDKRKEPIANGGWFDNIYADDGNFMMTKFAYNILVQGNQTNNPDNSLIIFRYADALLLRAEALAELNQNTEAITCLNLVRSRAGATVYSEGSSTSLKDFIFEERERELIGEGWHYFDLIRTKRVLNSKYAHNPLNSDQFDRGAWTWPVSQDALVNNPFMTLNSYWQ